MLNRLINEINISIREKSTAIFCGAGISYNSGLPLATDLVKNILDIIDIKDNDASAILNSNMPFEFFIETIKSEVSVDEILDVFSKGEPNINHKLIAELIKLGFIKTVLTTNFDLLIEKSLLIIGLKKGEHFDVFSTEEEFGNVNWDDNKIKIIKIHGCISNKSDMAITLDDVASKTVCENRNSIIKNFFSDKINPNILVIGYSCSDLFDISPQIELLKENSSVVFFIQHTGKEYNFKIEDISVENLKNPFKSFSGQRINVNSDHLVKKIWETFVIKPYKLEQFSTQWVENVKNG